MKIKIMREKSIEELKIELINLFREQFSLYIQNGNKKLNKTHLLKQVRKNISIIKTLITERQICNE